MNRYATRRPPAAIAKAGEKMRVFRPTRKAGSGKSVPYAKWYVEFRCHRETVRRLPAFTDRKQSEAFGRNVEKLVACRLSGEKPSGDLGRWVETLSNAIRGKLAKLDLLDARTMAASKAIAEHVEDFQAALLAKGGTEQHALQTVQRVKAIVAGCRFRFWSEIEASKVQRHLAELRQDREGAAGLSVASSNYYLAAFKQ